MSKGADEAVKAWIKGGPLEGSRDALSQSNVLHQIQDFYGAYQDFDVISSRDLSARVRVFYVAINFEKGPVFGRFNTYKSAQGWIITSFVFNTKEEVVLPATP